MMNSKILIIENEDIDRDRILGYLRNKGFTLFHAATKQAAVDLAKREMPSLVFADIELMTGTNDHLGIDAVLEIQSFCDARVVYLTNSQSLPSEAIAKIGKTGFKDYLSKSFNEAELMTAINNQLMWTPAEKVLFISYCHEDADIVSEMLKYLKSLGKVGVIPWLDSQIKFGTVWKDEIEKNLNACVAAILVCSQDFANSRFISEVELPVILQKHRTGKTGRVFTVFHRHAVPGDIRDLLDFHGVGSPNDPISEWSPEKRAAKCWLPLRASIEEFMNG
jgi:CheY-like chemotaxis protein